ncbi:hypothetical protein N182_13675 [Sinorhizobium sp. GL2]|nr:hypothetical protein N182_13675 [Sinorhizobium sp. GL2]
MQDYIEEGRQFPALQIAKLRLAVGFLGEREQNGWWPSAFLSATSVAFLSPVFGSGLLQVRYQGMLEAARRAHDDRIGVGRVFHPFRLPEVMEQRVFDTVQTAAPELLDAFTSIDAALAALKSLGSTTRDLKAGPALVGQVDILEDSSWISETASLYSAAFNASAQCFPYFAAAR